MTDLTNLKWVDEQLSALSEDVTNRWKQPTLDQIHDRLRAMKAELSAYIAQVELDRAIEALQNSIAGGCDGQ